MQLELFKAEQVNVYKDIESIDIAEIVDPTTGKLVLQNVKKDAYYLYKTGCPHKILKDQGDIFPGVYSKVSGKFGRFEKVWEIVKNGHFEAFWP